LHLPVWAVHRRIQLTPPAKEMNIMMAWATFDPVECRAVEDVIVSDD
jgi:cellobiose phosphorylase